MLESKIARLCTPDFLIGLASGIVAGVTLSLAALLATSVADGKRVPLAIVLTPTPLAPSPTADTRPHTLAAVNVYLGPGEAYDIIGVLARGQALDVIGRDASAIWLAISFPPGSRAAGWVQLAQVRGLPELAQLAVVQPTPLVAPSTPQAGGSTP